MTLNVLESVWQEPCNNPIAAVFRHGVTGVVASIVSDCVPNPLRVLKTVRQVTPEVGTSYTEIVSAVLNHDGMFGLLFRGLPARVLTNVMQGAFFSIVWRSLSE